MARPKMLTDPIKDYIVELKDGNPKLTAQEVISKVRDYLIANYKNGANFSKSDIAAIVDDELLSESAIIKYLSDINKKQTQQAKPSDIENEESPWHLGAKLDLPADAISSIFQVKKWLDDKRFEYEDKLNMFIKSDEYHTEFKDSWENSWDRVLKASNWKLTIREAKWISRLFEVKQYPKGKKPFSENPFELWRIARAYAKKERLSLLAETKFDTRYLDNAVLHGDTPSFERDGDFFMAYLNPSHFDNPYFTEKMDGETK